MRVVQCKKYGPPEGLQINEVDRPLPGKKEILVRIYATTVTFGDSLLRSMKFPLNLIFNIAFGLGRNPVLGHEFAGEVVEVGIDTTRFKTGDKVFGATGYKGGTYAEFLSVPEDSMVAKMPENMAFEEAAAVPVGGNTALFILNKGNIQPGDKVLIYGASGSVGTFAVQLARYLGANVTGVCSSKNLDLIKSLGADRVIDYTQEDFTHIGEAYDVIFDAVGKLSAFDCRHALKKDGTFLTTSSSTKDSVENISYLKELIEEGHIKAVIDRSYPLNEIVEAHRYVDRGHKKGNVVITVM